MPQFAANLSMMYPELPFLDRFQAAAQDGFKAVEYLFPYAYEATVLAARLRDHGLQLGEVARALDARHRGGIELRVNVVEHRLRYLVEHAPQPRARTTTRPSFCCASCAASLWVPQRDTATLWAMSAP